MIRTVIADDEEIIRNGLRKLIESSRSDVRVVATAENGEEALRKIEEHSPELVFMDINMPLLNGLDAIENIRKLNSETIIIIISGYSEFEYARRALSMGVFAYLLKPIDYRNFDSMLESAVEAYRKRIWEIVQISRNRKEPGGSLDKAAQAADFIRRNFTDNGISLSSVAARFDISCSYLTRIIKQKTGSSFTDYLSSLRLSAAEELLKGNEYNISQISDMIGFSSLHYFSRAFKNRTGLSPNAFRRARSEADN